uniref:hypothetical protein n=1 Tax=Ruminococcus intestinalis TaxID=2763066 RepID=UPI003F7D54DC
KSFLWIFFFILSSSFYNLQILNSASARDALVAFSDWLAMNPDCWDENGYDYSDLGRQAQKVYDDILYDNVYANKSNA